jgi:nucleotide-binding universal stress UspA family protein
MPFTVLVCTDGSELAEAAILDGLAVVAPPDRLVVATVVEPVDPSLVVGGGHAGGVLSPDQAQQETASRADAARSLLAATCDRLGLAGAETAVLEGVPGPALCGLAASLPASVILLGTRGRGGLRRAVLGSVSDHVVRNAPCPVVTRTAG